ncbi:hypothetical protein EB118_12285 [bacterium]|nr:hypothetical protein [bacterium]NDD83473.1 hypothetical protein [bacterium]NDG30836.1 hypothetical protein [bacterium]
MILSNSTKLIYCLITNTMSRSFTVDSVYRGSSKMRFTGGRYISMTPSGAARKAFSQATRNINGRVSLEIRIRETTQGSLGKSYKYRVSRKYDPISIERNGEIIEYKYTTTIRAI